MAGRRADLVVVGRLWVERVAQGSWLPKPGETIVATRCDAVIGGRGARQSVAAARLGLSVSLVSALGLDDDAESLVRWLEAEHVDTGRLRRDRGAPTGSALVHLDRSRTRQAMIFPEPLQALSPLDVDFAAEGIASARAALVSLEVPRETAARAIELSRLANARVILDAAGAAGTVEEETLPKLDVLHATAREAEALTGVEVRGPATAQTAADWLISRGLAAALIDTEPDGHMLATERGVRMFPRLGPASADARVADEAFVAALAAARAEGRTLDDAVTIASAAQGLVGLDLGVDAFPRRDAVLRHLDATTGRSWELSAA